MEKPSFSKKYTKAKEILNKLLKEQLNNRISNLESNSLKELAVLSTLSTSSNTILNNLTQYSSPKSSEISAKSTKNPIKIPKLKFDDIYTNGSNDAANDIVNACREANISPLHVAARIKQEVTGLTTSDSRLGGSFTYNGTTYNGYYNFYNIKSGCTNWGC